MSDMTIFRRGDHDLPPQKQSLPVAADVLVRRSRGSVFSTFVAFVTHVTLILLIYCALVAPVYAQSSKRLALVIGNDSYTQVAPLANARNDAKAIATELTAAGFDVTSRLDLGYFDTLNVVSAFIQRIQPGDEVAFFFAGHGVQIQKGNYLLPVDVPGTNETVVERSSIALDDLMDQIKRAGPRFTLMLIDACRDNPFKGTGRNIGEGRGLRPPEPPRGQLVVFSASRGQQALDKLNAQDTNPNGVFTREFIKKMRQRGVPVEQVARTVQSTVEQLAAQAGREQRPAIYNESSGNFYFYVADGGTVNITPLPPSATPGAVQRLSLEDLQREQKAREQWASWQKQMKADYDAVLAFKGSAELEVQAWERFLASWKDDNPNSGEDDSLRALARESLRLAGLSVQRERESRIEAERRSKEEAERQQAARVQRERDEATRQAAAQRAPTPAATAPGQTFRDCADCPEMVVIPAGRFTQGSPTEGPQRSVSVPAFALGKTTVTFAEWDACVAAGGCNGYRPDDRGSGRGSRPVIYINWDDAQSYAQWLSRKTGKRYSLPSESQWEYATRAGTATAYYWGDAVGSGNANCNGCGSQWDNKQTAPVGSFRPNAFGLYDMAGNVWQWTADCWNESYNGAPTDGSAWTSGNCARRVVRGGSWDDGQGGVRSAVRNRSVTSYRSVSLGFRVLRTAD
jgi:formylglycine-generating enzyme required for sulfatase activity